MALDNYLPSFISIKGYKATLLRQLFKTGQNESGFVAGGSASIQYFKRLRSRQLKDVQKNQGWHTACLKMRSGRWIKKELPLPYLE